LVSTPGSGSRSTSSLSSYSSSSTSLTGRRSPYIGSNSNEAMPALRARMARSAALRNGSVTPNTSLASQRLSRTTSHSVANNSTPSSNPVLMVQEMVGRVKVRFQDYY
jgi:hypothetical protein